MPRDAAGQYTLPAGNPVVTGTTISTAWANLTMPDLATAMQDSLSRSGLGGMTAPLEHSAGAVGAPSMTFGDEPQSGWYRAAAGDIRFAVAGVDVFRFNSGQAQIWDVSEALWFPLVTSNTVGAVVETATLDGIQTDVTFTKSVAGAALYVDGTSGDRGRLLITTDYTYDAPTNVVTLLVIYPVNTKLFAVINDESDVAVAAAAAQASAAAALVSEQAADATYDEFDDRYLGAKSSPPTLDNDGNALITGAMYWNTPSAVLYVWGGAAWFASSAAGLGTAAFIDVGTGAAEIPQNSDLGNASLKTTGTGAGNVPLNSDLGDASTKTTGTAAGEVPLNSDLGDASTKTVGTAAGEVPLNSDLTPPAVTGYVAARFTYYSDTLQGVFVVDTNLAATVEESIGPISSGADNESAVFDDIPAGAAFVILDVNINATSTASGVVGVNLATHAGTGTSETDTDFDFYATAGSQFSRGVPHRIQVPLDANLVFSAKWSVANASSQTITYTYVGYGI
jgi:hypothetical protein